MKPLILNNKKLLLIIALIIISPLFMMIFNAVVMSIFNIGTYIGSYLRTIINTGIC